MHRGLRWLNVLVALVTLASALAVLASNLLDPDYQGYYHDRLSFVLAYVAVQVWMMVQFARGGRWVPWLAVAKAVAAYVFLLTWVHVGPDWLMMTPARYVYSLFDWGPENKTLMYAFVFLGRGVWNTLNAFALTEEWWRPLRARRPVLGRLVTAVPLAIVVTCVWKFMDDTRHDARTFSPEAYEVAATVARDLECEIIRTRQDQTTTDLRQRGEQRYEVAIRYGCPRTQIVVRAQDGRLGTATTDRPECCATPS